MTLPFPNSGIMALKHRIYLSSPLASLVQQEQYKLGDEKLSQTARKLIRAELENRSYQVNKTTVDAS